MTFLLTTGLNNTDEYSISALNITDCSCIQLPVGGSTREVCFVCPDWLQQLERGNEIGAIFFYFEKAFDRVFHQLLISKLMGLGLDLAT